MRMRIARPSRHGLPPSHRNGETTARRRVPLKRPSDLLAAWSRKPSLYSEQCDTRAPDCQPNSPTRAGSDLGAADRNCSRTLRRKNLTPQERLTQPKRAADFSPHGTAQAQTHYPPEDGRLAAARYAVACTGKPGNWNARQSGPVSRILFPTRPLAGSSGDDHSSGPGVADGLVRAQRTIRRLCYAFPTHCHPQISARLERFRISSIESRTTQN